MIIEGSKKKTLLPKVMRAALQLFVQKGIDGATTKDIAKAAKVAEGTLYRHFKSKNEMAWHIFHSNLGDLTAKLFEVTEEPKTAKDKLKAAIHSFYDYCEKDPVLFSFLILTQHQEIRKFPPTDKIPSDVLVRIIEHGRKTGEVGRIETPLAAALLLGMIRQIPESRSYGRMGKDLMACVEPVTEACMRVLKG